MGLHLKSVFLATRTIYNQPTAFEIVLTLYSIRTPFDAFEITCIGKYYGKWSVCSKRANAPFSIIFS